MERNDVHSAIQHENLRKECLLSAFSVACDERCLLLDEICAELKKCMEAPQLVLLRIFYHNHEIHIIYFMWKCSHMLHVPTMLVLCD